jgi:hypothetical protein
VGLLLGAGASVDFGLPMVGQVTSKLRDCLTEEKLWSIQMAALARNDGYPNEIVYEVLNILKRIETDCSTLLKETLTTYRRSSVLDMVSQTTILTK